LKVLQKQVGNLSPATPISVFSPYKKPTSAFLSASDKYENEGMLLRPVFNKGKAGGLPLRSMPWQAAQFFWKRAAPVMVNRIFRFYILCFRWLVSSKAVQQQKIRWQK
jgi:hypothetical protein